MLKFCRFVFNVKKKIPTPTFLPLGTGHIKMPADGTSALHPHQRENLTMRGYVNLLKNSCVSGTNFLIQKKKLESVSPRLFHGVYNSLESLRVVHGQVGEHLAVELNVLLGDFADEFRVRHVVAAYCCIDTCDPKSTEVALFHLPLNVGVQQAFLISVLCNGVYVSPCSEITSGEFEDFFASSARGNDIH